MHIENAALKSLLGTYLKLEIEISCCGAER